MVKSKYVSVNQMCNDKSNDDLLCEAIANFCQQTPETRERDKAFAHLWSLILKFQIPRTSPHPRYPDLLQEIQLEFSQRICTEFEQIKAGKKSFVHSLRLWMNWYGLRLGFRIMDLDREDKKKNERETSLDAPISGGNNDGNTPTLVDVTAGKFDPMETLIREDFKEKLSAAIQTLVCHPKDYPQCTCAEIYKRRFYRNPPQKFTEISKELNLPYQALMAHNRRKCKPLLKKIYNELLGGE
ncbi:hypothetical protein ACP6PL_25360 [Dapis sp. BLCC M126]|uniref:hypothetical protein n=1 Tax=Dapis sp. BLCC M126 TaxID=3400189 RepID=UPI003CF2EC6A